jgi:hypothetical protein
MATDLPGFHDGFLDGLFTFGSQARIFLRKQNGEKFTLVIHGLERLQGEDFRQGNIVFDVVFLEPDEIEGSDVCELYQFSEEAVKTFSLAEWLVKAKEKGLKAVQISPSYGCSVQALFQTYELIPGFRASSNEHNIQVD